MKITFISDTHGLHEQVALSPGDILIHGGDISGRGFEEELKEFFSWFSDQPFDHKILIAGNHDFFFQDNPSKVKDLIPDDVTYLEDSGTYIKGINFWGSPVQPRFMNWAFNRDRGEDIKFHWDLIPDGIDVLITHGPPAGILDFVIRDQSRVGCQDLLETVQRIKPKIHAFGHIHGSYGREEKNNILFLNSSVLNESYTIVNDPHVIDYEKLTN